MHVQVYHNCCLDPCNTGNRGTSFAVFELRIIELLLETATLTSGYFLQELKVWNKFITIQNYPVLSQSICLLLFSVLSVELSMYFSRYKPSFCNSERFAAKESIFISHSIFLLLAACFLLSHICIIIFTKKVNLCMDLPTFPHHTAESQYFGNINY